MIITLKPLSNGPSVRSGEDVPVAGGTPRPRQRLRKARHEPSTEVGRLAMLQRFARGELTIAIGAPLLAGALLVPQLWMFAHVVHAAVVESASTAELAPNVAEIIALMAVRALLVWTGETYGDQAAASITLALRKALFGRLIHKHPDWTASRSSGELTAAIIEQVGALDPYFARYVPAMALAAALPIVFAVTALSVDPVVGVLFLVSAPLIPVFMALVGWGAEAASAQHQQAFLRLSGFFADRLRGLLTLKLLGRGAEEARRLREAGEDLRLRTLTVLRIAFLSSAVLEFFAALGVAGVALYVGLSYLGFLHLRSAPLTLQTGLFCLVLAPEVYFPLRQFAAHYHDRAAAKAALAALGSMFEGLPALVATETPPAEIQSLGGPRAASIVISGLSVRTPDGRLPVLAEVQATIRAGTRVAIIGASGSGKSTFLEAVARLRSAQGCIEIDGLPISDIPEGEFRARVAVLGQRPRLFQGSIADNIRFGRPEARDNQIREAAERASVLRFTTSLREGLATRVGEGGLGLSGGEARRVALARVFLRRPDLILFDEPTAYLDRLTEDAVLDGILDFANGRTLIIATHSDPVVRRMGAVLRIKDHRLLPTLCGRRCVGAGRSAKLKSTNGRRELRLS